MDYLSSIAIVILAALVHASFQLSVSVLTLMSGHTIGSKQSHTRLLKLTNGFVLGAGTMTLFTISFVAYIASLFFDTQPPLLIWAACCGILVGLGVSVWLFYYRKERGTSLWIPRGMATYLSNRSKQTKQSAEAFGLGLTSVAGELLFIVAPITVAALILITAPSEWQLIGVLGYTFISLSPLFIVNALIGSGHKLSTIQRWRESNKQFLQFSAGAGMFVLGFFVYVDQVLSVLVIAPGVQ